MVIARAAANPYAAFWFGIFYTAFYLADTVTNVPYEALGPELSDSYNERSRIYFVHKFFNMLGALLLQDPASGRPVP